MKKSFVIILITFLLIQIVASQSNITNNNHTAINKIGDATDSLAEKEIQIPNNLQLIARLILGIKSPIEFSLLIIIIIIWVMTFKLIGEGVKLMPFFEKGVMSWVATFIIIMLIVFAGGLNLIASVILGLADIFTIFRDWSTGALIFGITLVIIIGFFISKLEKWARKKSEIEKAKFESTNLGISLGFMGNLRKMLGFGKSLS